MPPTLWGFVTAAEQTHIEGKAAGGWLADVVHTGRSLRRRAGWRRKRRGDGRANERDTAQLLLGPSGISQELQQYQHGWQNSTGATRAHSRAPRSPTAKQSPTTVLVPTPFPDHLPQSQPG